MSIDKGIGGGFPLGRLPCHGRAGHGMTACTHGHLRGIRLAMAGRPTAGDRRRSWSPAILQESAQGLLPSKQRLAESEDRHPGVSPRCADSAHDGLRTLRAPNTDFIAAARDEKLILIAAGDNVARMLPPLIVTEADVGEAMNRIDAACSRLESELKAVATRGAAE
jgi:acetylornithine/N-succinyldiaminopimelate aminotransferase